ncbi:MAG: hypothetical protein KDD94_03190 [Calditrichaeota bacterium]|nr:hypothetical protein [Calditrichota bacterium]
MIFFLIFSFQVDTVVLSYDQSIHFNAREIRIIDDNFSDLIDFAVDSNGNVFVLNQHQNKLILYSGKLMSLKHLDDGRVSSTGYSMVLSQNLILVRGWRDMIFDLDLHIRQKDLKALNSDNIVSLIRFSGSNHLLMKPTRYQRGFYLVELDDNYQSDENSRQNFPADKGKSLFTTSVAQFRNQIIQTFAGNYLLESISSDNKRIIYRRPYRRILENRKQSSVTFVSNNKKQVYESDILEILCTNRNFIYLRTSTTDEKRLEFDIVDLDNRRYRHLFMNFPDNVYSAKLNGNYLLIQLVSQGRSRLTIYEID